MGAMATPQKLDSKLIAKLSAKLLNDPITTPSLVLKKPNIQQPLYKAKTEAIWDSPKPEDHPPLFSSSVSLSEVVCSGCGEQKAWQPIRDVCHCGSDQIEAGELITKPVRSPEPQP